MSDLSVLFDAENSVRRWRAESENASARLELAMMHKNIAHLISQREPIAGLGLDRERLRLALRFVVHGNEARLANEFEELCVSEARKR